MKTKFTRLLQRPVLLGAMTLLAFGGVSQVQAQFDPTVWGPNGWDFTISGNARGIAHLTFNTDFTVTGAVHIITSKRVGSSDSDDRSLTDGGRNNGESTNSAPAITNFFGSAVVVGQWSFHPVSHKVIGFLNEWSVIETATSTNTVLNTLTFRGVGKGGTRPRLTLSGTGPLGRQTFQGVPLQALPDIAGTYGISGTRAGHTVTEFLTLTSTGQNTYNVAGAGPGQVYIGDAILSARKQLSIVTESLGTNAPTITALVGSFNTNKLSGTLKGRDTSGKVSVKVFDVPDFP